MKHVLRLDVLLRRAQKNMDTRGFCFTLHASQRAEQFGLSTQLANHYAENSKYVTPPKFVLKKKVMKYGYHQKAVYYRQYGEYLFTCVNEYHKKTGEPVILVLTVSNTRIQGNLNWGPPPKVYYLRKNGRDRYGLVA